MNENEIFFLQLSSAVCNQNSTYAHESIGYDICDRCLYWLATGTDVSGQKLGAYVL